MKKVLLLLLVVCSITYFKGQICNPPSVPTDIYYPNSTTTPTNVQGYEYLCGPNTIVYDTINSGCHFIYVNSNNTLIFKYGICASTSQIWLKNNSTLTILAGTNPIAIYYEPLAIINNTPGIIVSSYSCTSIIFPTVNCSPNGINEVRSGNEELNIYPNPTTGKLIIKQGGFNKIILTNCLDQTVYILIDPSPKQEIDLSSFANGIYFLKAETKGGQKVFKILKE